MKKSLIAASASAVALAAMPVVGVFAASDLSIKDTINLTVSPTCKIMATPSDLTIPVTMTANDSKDNIAGSTMSITCNNYQGWYLTAAGAGSTNYETALHSATATDIPGTFSSTTSYWQYKLTGEKVASSGTFTNIPAASGSTVASSDVPTTDSQITAGYKIVTINQGAADDFTGAVSYTLTAGPQ